MVRPLSGAASAARFSPCFFTPDGGKQKIRLFNISLQQDLVLDNEMFRRILLGRMGKIGRVGFFNLAFRFYSL